MRHSYIDNYSNINSFIHRIDPRIKIVSFVIFILSIVFTTPNSFLTFGLYGLLLVVLTFFSKIPVGFIFKRSLMIAPFVLMITVFIPFIATDGWEKFWNILIKSYLSILCMIILTNSTEFADFLKALQSLRMPRLFVMILSFMYRYIFVVQDELMKMNLARQSRSVGKLKWLKIKALSHIVGVLFVRSYERAESVYMAMCSRGFNGDIKTM